jgi:hypothetical protein
MWELGRRRFDVSEKRWGKQGCMFWSLSHARSWLGHVYDARRSRENLPGCSLMIPLRVRYYRIKSNTKAIKRVCSTVGWCVYALCRSFQDGMATRRPIRGPSLWNRVPSRTSPSHLHLSIYGKQDEMRHAGMDMLNPMDPQHSSRLLWTIAIDLAGSSYFGRVP